ncbi:MAG: hypothetical protein EBR67_08730 [Proteobacteria bacterium]|nr:hypothetical protein [Pseudomonadota bacterium]
MTRTKTLTLGEPYIKELIISLKKYIEILRSSDEKSVEEVRRLGNLIAYYESAPWNEGGYNIIN